MKKRIIKSFNTFFVLLSFLMCFTPKASAQGASMYFSYSSLQVGLNDNFSIKVMLNTGGESVNTTVAAISYPADKLQFVSVDDTNSVLSEGMSPDTGTTGVVEVTRYVSGGDSYSGTGEFVTFNFRSLESGTAPLSFTDDSYVSAGGDNLLGSTGTSTIYISNLPGAGIFDKPKLLLTIFAGFSLFGLGSLGILQIIKEKKNKQLTLN